MENTEKRRIFTALEELTFIGYGKVIPREVLARLFDIEYEDDWEYRGSLLEMKVFIEYEGYLCTTQDQREGDLKILDIDQMAYKACSLMNNIFKKMDRLKVAMRDANVSELGDKELRKHMHESNKIDSALKAMTSSLAKL